MLESVINVYCLKTVGHRIPSEYKFSQSDTQPADALMSKSSEGGLL